MVVSLNILILDSSPPRNIEEAVCVAAKEVLKGVPVEERVTPRVVIDTSDMLFDLPVGYDAYLINADNTDYGSLLSLRQKQPNSKIFLFLTTPSEGYRDYTHVADKVGYAPRLKDIKDLLSELIKH